MTSQLIDVREVTARERFLRFTNRPRFLYGWRVTFALITVVAAFFDSFRSIVAHIFNGTANYSVLVFAMAVVLFVGLDRSRARALNIHDREVDYIIGGIAIIIAMEVKIQLLPRFEEWDPMLRLDVFAILIFSFGVSGLLFGMRSTLHFGPGWLVLFIYNAPVYLYLSVIFGGGFWGPAIANVIGMTLAIIFASNRGVVQSVYFGAMNLVFGSIIALVTWFFIGDPGLATHIPSVLSTIIVVVVGSQGKIQQWSIRRRPPTVKNAKPAAVVVLVAAVILSFYSSPGVWEVSRQPQNGPGTPSKLGITAPVGWEITDFNQFEWASRFFGEDSSLTRQMLKARHVNPAWDLDGRARIVAVDTLKATELYQSRAFGDEAIYSTLTGRRSEAVEVQLGNGVLGRAYTVLDERNLLTYTKLIFEWQREVGIIEKVTVIAVDDHREEAQFPQLAPSGFQMLSQITTILLRGNAVTVDDETAYKDLDLVSQVGRGIVAREEGGF